MAEDDVKLEADVAEEDAEEQEPQEEAPAEEAAPPKPMFYGGKYVSQEELERAHGELERELGRQGQEVAGLRQLAARATATEEKPPATPEEEQIARLQPLAQEFYSELVAEQSVLLRGADFSEEEISQKVQAVNRELGNLAWDKARREDARRQRDRDETMRAVEPVLAGTVYAQAVQSALSERPAEGIDSSQIVSVLQKAVPVAQWRAAAPEIQREWVDLMINAAIGDRIRRGGVTAGATVAEETTRVNIPQQMKTGGKRLTSQQLATVDWLLEHNRSITRDQAIDEVLNPSP